VFRGAVTKNGVPVSDILQVWLDVSQHPSRGREPGRSHLEKSTRTRFRGEIVNGNRTVGQIRGGGCPKKSRTPGRCC
jgi:hypothetical protein